MPVFTASDAVSTVHVLFGDASYMYLGVRGGIRFQSSVEAGFATDDIYIRALERFTAMLMATGAMSGVITHSS
jgi:HK97 family phage major capsid protein